MDMSGGAAVLETVAAIAELGLELDVVAVIPSTENMPSGTATRPGDIITQLNGKTVEVNNTDAEGRLILADALTWCVREMGADRVVDIATLTGAVVYRARLHLRGAGLERRRPRRRGRGLLEPDRRARVAPAAPPGVQGTDDGHASRTSRTPARSRRPAAIYAASFLEEFVDDRPWAHLDIAGTAWDTGREYVGKGPTGFGARLLITLAQDSAA